MGEPNERTRTGSGDRSPPADAGWSAVHGIERVWNSRSLVFERKHCDLSSRKTDIERLLSPRSPSLKRRLVYILPPAYGLSSCIANNLVPHYSIP